MNFELEELCQSPVRPPVPEVPRAEQLARERQMVFHSHRAGQVPHGAPPNPVRDHQPIPGQDSGPVHAADVCVLDERGGHRKLGMRCPHGLRDADFVTVTQVDL